MISSETLDRTGVIASVLCAIHCAVAPMLIVVAPTLGGLWVHPLAHLGIAALVLPVAGFALRRGFQAHRLRWIAVLGGVGIALVLLGSAYPYFTAPASGCEAGCEQCCPSYVVDPVTGEERLNIPPASVITLMGGVSLVVAHVANLRSCARCCD
ncbi:MAG: MerC domain-containing protein [Planctomycetota bacterium]|nr:MerC domain-containing protein [Planctomycetota bacterium]MEC9047862.1 MerC domain-containing protein [Planctomycetota bacterium]